MDTRNNINVPNILIMEPGDEVICIEDTKCSGIDREIKKGEILTIRGGSTKAIYFTITANGAGNYCKENFILLSKWKKKQIVNYEIF